MDEFAEIRLNQKHPEILRAFDEQGFNVLLFHSLHRARRPVHKLMAQRVFADLGTEGVSESSFSTHGMYASKLRKTLGPKIAAAMVKAKKNHSLLYERIKKEVWPRYQEKYRNQASAFVDVEPGHDE